MAQEIGSSSNVRFRQSADRLRSQFVKSLGDKYNLASWADSLDIKTSLSTMDRPNSLKAAAIKEEITLQLKRIDTAASDVLFYNEPLPHLEQYRYSPGFPLDALAAFAREEQAPAAAEGGSSGSDESLFSSSQRATFDVLLRAKQQRESRNPSLVQQQQEDLRRLKAALRSEAQKWRSEGGASGALERRLIDPVVGSILNSPQPGPGTVDVAAQRAARHSEKATYARWRAVMDGIASASLDSPSSSPNYALVVQNCLLACLASYNLRLAPLSLQGMLGDLGALDGAGLDAAKRTLQAVSEAALAADSVAGAGVQGLAALAGSALDLVKDAATSTQGSGDKQGTPAEEGRRQALAVEQARVERLARLSVGASSSTDAPLRSDKVTVRALQSTKA
jgi:hypothetical protein